MLCSSIGWSSLSDNKTYSKRASNGKPSSSFYQHIKDLFSRPQGLEEAQYICDLEAQIMQSIFLTLEDLPPKRKWNKHTILALGCVRVEKSVLEALAQILKENVPVIKPFKKNL